LFVNNELEAVSTEFERKEYLEEINNLPYLNTMARASRSARPNAAVSVASA